MDMFLSQRDMMDSILTSGDRAIPVVILNKPDEKDFLVSFQYVTCRIHILIHKEKIFCNKKVLSRFGNNGLI